VAPALKPFEPGQPTTLFTDLWFPARLVLRDGALYFANRPRLGNLEAQDALVRVALTANTPSMVSLLQAPSIDGFTLSSDEIWIASVVQNAFSSFSVDGQPHSVVPGASRMAVAVAHNSREIYLGSIDGVVEALPHGSETPRPLYSGRENDVPQWFGATEEALYAAFESGPSNQLVRIDVSDGHVEVLAERATRFGGFAVHSDGIYFADAEGGTVELLANGSTSSEVIANVPHPWALVVDADHLYVSTQPVGYCATGLEGDLRRIDRASGEITVLASDLACPSMLVASADALYWVNNGTASTEDGFEAHGNGSLMKLSRPD
jgi:hypothetical protein